MSIDIYTVCNVCLHDIMSSNLRKKMIFCKKKKKKISAVYQQQIQIPNAKK